MKKVEKVKTESKEWLENEDTLIWLICVKT